MEQGVPWCINTWVCVASCYALYLYLIYQEPTTMTTIKAWPTLIQDTTSVLQPITSAYTFAYIILYIIFILSSYKRWLWSPSLCHQHRLGSISSSSSSSTSRSVSSSFSSGSSIWHTSYRVAMNKHDAGARVPARVKSAFKCTCVTNIGQLAKLDGW